MPRWLWAVGLTVCAQFSQAQLELDCAQIFRATNDRLIQQLAVAGINANCNYFPPARGAQQVASGVLHGAMLRTEDFGAVFTHLKRIEPAAHKVMVLLYRRQGSAVDINNWREQSIISLRGAVVLDRMLAGLNVSRVGNLESGLKQLSAGRADVLVGEQQMVPSLMNDWGIDNVEVVYPPLATRLLYIYLHPDHAAMAATISTALMQEVNP